MNQEFSLRFPERAHFAFNQSAALFTSQPRAGTSSCAFGSARYKNMKLHTLLFVLLEFRGQIIRMSKSFAIIHNHHLLLPEMITCKGAFPVKLFLVIYRQYRLYLKRPSRRRIRARAHVRWILMSRSVSFPLLGCLSISKAHDHCPMPLLTLKEYITITPHLLLPRY